MKRYGEEMMNVAVVTLWKRTCDLPKQITEKDENEHTKRIVSEPFWAILYEKGGWKPVDPIIEIERLKKPSKKNLPFLQNRFFSLKRILFFSEFLIFKHYVTLLSCNSCWFMTRLGTGFMGGSALVKYGHSPTIIQGVERVASLSSRCGENFWM